MTMTCTEIIEPTQSTNDLKREASLEQDHATKEQLKIIAERINNIKSDIITSLNNGGDGVGNRITNGADVKIDTILSFDYMELELD